MTTSKKKSENNLHKLRIQNNLNTDEKDIFNLANIFELSIESIEYFPF